MYPSPGDYIVCGLERGRKISPELLLRIHLGVIRSPSACIAHSEQTVLFTCQINPKCVEYRTNEHLRRWHVESLVADNTSRTNSTQLSTETKVNQEGKTLALNFSIAAMKAWEFY
jgi:hypothetical protein